MGSWEITDTVCSINLARNPGCTIGQFDLQGRADMEGKCLSEVYCQVYLRGSTWASKQISSWALTGSKRWEYVEEDMEIKRSSKSTNSNVEGLFKHAAHKR